MRISSIRCPAGQDFDARRVRPNFSLDARLGADLWKQEKRALRLQIVVDNLTNRLNVLNSARLFSGPAMAPLRGSTGLQYDF